MKKDLDRTTMYESVKQLVETQENHIHLPQQKLFTLFSIAFQYFLFQSSKNPGVYLLRIEDSMLATKLQRKAKDDITRKFLGKISLPRKLKYGNSYFYLDFFHIGSWAITKDIDQSKIKGALIVKNTINNPIAFIEEDNGPIDESYQVEEESSRPNSQTNSSFEIPKDFYLSSLTSFVPKTITIAFGEIFPELTQVKFNFIQDEEEENEQIEGLKLAKDLDLSKFQD